MVGEQVHGTTDEALIVMNAHTVVPDRARLLPPEHDPRERWDRPGGGEMFLAFGLDE